MSDVVKFLNPFSSTSMKLANPIALLGGPDPVGNYINPKLPKIPGLPSAPTEDTAANAANQAADLARKRRGVLANIYAGSQDFKPQVAVKQLLGT